jgi:hypothetical protein
MASVITHKKVSKIPNGTDPTVVQPVDWNDDHEINLPELTGKIMPIVAITEGPLNIPAVSGNGIFNIYNGASAPFTVLLPPNPAPNQVAQIIDAGLTAGAYTITVNGNGNEICAYGAIGSSAGIDSNGGSISLAWDGIQWTQNA